MSQPPRPRLQSQTTENVGDSRRTWLILGILAAVLVVGGVLFGVAFGDEDDEEPTGTPVVNVVEPVAYGPFPAAAFVSLP